MHSKTIKKNLLLLIVNDLDYFVCYLMRKYSFSFAGKNSIKENSNYRNVDKGMIKKSITKRFSSKDYGLDLILSIDLRIKNKRKKDKKQKT